MKRLLIPILFTFVAGSLMGCPSRVVRDDVTYQTELNQYNSWATKQADLLREFVGDHCACDTTDMTFTTQRCADSADFILTIEARADWHLSMSRYLAGITDERPEKNPPEIPPSSTLCPEGGE